MSFKNQHHFIEELERAGELIRIKEFVDPHLEIAEVVDRVSKADGVHPFPLGEGQGVRQNKALLFENTGTPFPLLINAMGSEKRMCMVLGVDHLDDVAEEIDNLFHSLSSPKDSIIDKLKVLPQLGRISSWMPKNKNGKGECQEVVMKDPDITKLPVLKCWPHDGGNFLTLPIIHTIDPNSGIRNVGLYRMQVFGSKLAALHWHKHKVSAGHFNEYKKLGKRMPVAVALGGDPVYVFTAASPLPSNVDEYFFAGFLRKKKVELVKCLTQAMYVPADADIIIEGYVDPNEEFILEGPFGDHTGYYSLADYYPKFHITCITHKKNAIYPATIVGIPPQEDAWIGKAIERIFLAPMKMTVIPEIVDMAMPVEGVFHNLVIVKIKKEYEGHAQKVMNAMWGAGQMMFNKILVIVDGETNIHDYEEVAHCISDNVNPASDIYFSQGTMDVLDHACSKFAFGGKMCVDATQKESHLNPPHKGGLKIQWDENEKKMFPEIVGINFSLFERGIFVVFVSIKKNRKNHIRELNEKLFNIIYNTPPLKGEVGRGLFVIYVEDTVDVMDIKDTMWRFANNFDPKRDSYFSRPHQPLPIGEDLGGASGIGLDGTRKTKAFDNFDRPWPNIICADDATIKSVDEKWRKIFRAHPQPPPSGGAIKREPLPSGEKLGRAFSFIPSPSLKYKKMLYKGGAVAEE
ncbi:MAG: menaquinone biosynthesis decarboxylase [Bacteroidetes bacterium]|nr:menaquinone biosynthesis decarboxylase [Bacteroidota bacterium]